ncbi:DUF4314 domain-containing protein [Micromonospora sp. WMMD980]|uniref:DUF4314 domain-containing protein n=1 Tax=Micromonospora sp. WMMD980 TaxID=3016088 RepID=UPI00241723F3|nr:DUF4314 domain-containing protein [Micromonospora sp. WMMD980]MDG4803646.1 DUF4314 domain-containing protein [Micromonospora sp. WMMD980]
MTSPTSHSQPDDQPTSATYRRGDRVVLAHTSDPHTRLRPGDEGTIRRYEPHGQVLDVAWDNGSTLSLLLGESDRVRRLPAPHPADLGRQVREALRAAGAAAGRDAAAWWAQHTLAGQARGDVTDIARQVLSGIEDVVPLILDGLPTANRYLFAEDAERYTEHAPPNSPGWQDLSAQQRDQARWAWCGGYDDAAHAEAERQCRIILHPDGDDRDLTHVHPDHVRLGGTGVFAGDWAWQPNADGQMRIPVGFAGTLVDLWNGWAVFTCTRDVAQAIVADQQAARDNLRQSLAHNGIAEADLDRAVDQSMARLSFDGDIIVADATRLADDPEAIDRISPDADGRYVVMGRSWPWRPVHPYDCDRIVGAIPDPPTNDDTAQNLRPQGRADV